MFKKLLLAASARLLAGSGAISSKVSELIATAETKNLPGADKYQWVCDRAKNIMSGQAPHVVQTVIQLLVTKMKAKAGA